MASAPVKQRGRLHYEDIEVGSRFESPWHTITAEEIVCFARDWDPYPFHVDAEAAADSFFGGLTACAAHLFALQSRLAHDLLDDVALLAGLGGEGMNLLAAVRPGDRLQLVRTYTDKRPSRSRTDRGVVGIEHTLENLEGEVVYRTQGKILVARRAPAAR